MREIKFRGRCGNTGDANIDWVYGNLVEELSTKRTFIVDLSHFNEGTTFEEIATEVDSETTGQFIGIKDKNSKEIYEGDNVKGECQTGDNQRFKGSGEVVFHSVSGTFAVKVNNSFFPIGYFMFTIEIIGNIHENPELLEKEKK